MSWDNKGKKMSPEVYEKTRHTRFTKDNRSGRALHNYVPIGHETIRTDGYTWVKVAERKWEATHRLLYEKSHGPIPPGGVVRFRDGNPMNFLPDNLHLVTKAENSRLNRAGVSTFSLITDRAAKNRLKRRGITAKVIKSNPGLIEMVQAEILLTIQKRK